MDAGGSRSTKYAGRGYIVAKVYKVCCVHLMKA